MQHWRMGASEKKLLTEVEVQLVLRCWDHVWRRCAAAVVGLLCAIRMKSASSVCCQRTARGGIFVSVVSMQCAVLDVAPVMRRRAVACRLSSRLRVVSEALL